MTITPEQIVDLQPGDIVRYTGHPQANGATVEGPVYAHTDGSLRVGPGLIIKTATGLPVGDTGIVLAFVSRSVRPLYTNHSRTTEVSNDVARMPGTGNKKVWFYTAAVTNPGWYDATGTRFERPAGVSLELLVDGETGQVVP